RDLAAIGKVAVLAMPGDSDELLQHVVEKETQPHALALALTADQIHPVVPVARTHQRQAVLTEAQTVLDGTDTMLVERCRFLRALRHIVVAFLFRPEQPTLEKMNAFIEHPEVANAGYIAADGVGQPQVVVGNTRAHTA